MSKPLEACVHCHVCQKNCDFLTKYGIDIGDTERLKELAYHCFLCGKCTEVCPIDIDGRNVVLNFRREIVEEDRNTVEKQYRPAIAEKRNYKFRNWKHVNEGTIFFPGCNFPSLFPKTAAEVSRLFAENGIGTVYECCGKPVSELGFKDDEERILNEIRQKIDKNRITEIVLACPNCRGFFADRLGVKITSVYTKLNELGLGKTLDGDKCFYIPCPDRELKQWIEELKPFINGDISFVEGVQCCGLGGNAIALEKELSAGFTEKFKQAGHGQVYTYCASCTGRIKRNGCDSINHILTEILETKENPDTGKSYLNRVFTKFK